MKNKFLFLALMLLIGTQVAVDAQELTLSDVQNSGCLDSKHARANGRANINEYNRRPTIILTKEGTILTVQLYNYEANCGTTDFEVTPSISGGSNGAPYSVSIQVIPIGDEEDCICPYNISFTIHDLEATDFFFSCCWFQGLVTLTENKPLVLGDINEVVMAEVNIDGLNYTLENITNTARLIAAKRGYDIKGELNIPSEINYEEQKYRVTSLNEYAFLGCYDLTSVDIPYSVTSIGDAAFMGCSSLTDVYCHAEDVPNTSNSVFTSTPIASATLHVPAGSIDKYKTTSPWSDFGSIVALPQQYFPEGTKWTEIRLDTLKYDSWYSKVDGEWVPNFETIEYRVQGEYGEASDNYWNAPYKCVYTNASEWTDSLTLLISEGELNGLPTGVLVTVYDNYDDQPLVPSSYPFEWEVGTMIRFKDILAANMTALFPPGTFDFGVVEEINEGDFGGVRLLKYSDVKGVRMIQGIGVATWNDGECIFGPLKPYDALPLPHEESRHYRSMLVHFERDGEVLYDVWPRKGGTVEVAIDGLNYFLYLDTHEAVIITNRTCSGELDIPSEVTYEGETFVVKSMTWSAFHNNPELTKVKIPKTIESIRHSYPADPDEDVETTLINPIYMNPFRGCTALESIEVDEENPSLKSVDGVLFSQDGVGQYYYRTGNYSGTGLYCYPEGARQKSYTIPENVEWIAGAACANNQYLTVLTIPNSTKHICYDAFSGCCNLTDVYCKAENVPVAWDGAFRDAHIASATLHVPASSIDKYKATSPWSEFGNIVEMTTSKGIMPFVQDGKVWTYEASNFIYDWEETFSLEGDTLISSRKCLKLYYTCQFYHQEHLYKGAMFEEEGKVYFFASGSTTPVLLYDFSYEPGTIIKVGDFELRINETRLAKYRSEYLKVIDYCILGNEHYPFKGIEGVGFLGGGLTCLIDGYTPVNTGGESSLKTCAVNGEVVFDLQDFYTSAQIVTNEPVTFTQDQMATIILPTAPDASKGKYYRLDRVENGQIVFEQEKQPRARVPYIIVPSEDFSIDISSLDLESLQADTVTVGGVSFIGSYVRKTLPQRGSGEGAESFYIDIIDTTPDCGFLSTAETGKEAFRIGALRAYLTVNWDDPYNHHGSKSPEDKLDIVLKDDGTGIEQIQSSKFKIQNDGEEVNGKWSNGKCYDLSGRKWSMINGQRSMPKGIYIQNSRKLVK